MSLKSQNGYPVLDSAAQTFLWTVPGANRTLRLAPGHLGFLIVHFVTWYDRNIVRIAKGIFDDWAWAVRNVRGSTTSISNHSSGTAVDLDATQHPLGRIGTFLNWQVIKINARLVWMAGVLRWGRNYHGRKDEMHFEIVASYDRVTKQAARLAKTPIGRAVIAANPGYHPAHNFRPGERDLHEGLSGPDVRWVQNHIGVPGVDGVYGPKTAARVRLFEESVKHSHPNLKVDGVVGKRTWIVFGIKPRY